MNEQYIHYKAPEFVVEPGEPFKQDRLNRKRSAVVLTQFLETLSEPFVLAIDAPWGAGKSTFLRMWTQQLKNDGFKCLCFNAWETDFAESPLVSIIGELEASIDLLAVGSPEKSAIVKTFEKTKKYGAALLKFTLPTAVKFATSGIVDAKEFSDLAEELAKKRIEKYKQDKESLMGFRESLRRLVESIEKREGSGDVKPVVFVIDELDRCRPDYAIELLENLKHLFSVRGLVFVLALDIEQTAEAIKAVYGAGLNADGYLRRFIDLRFRLPAPDPSDAVAALISRFNIDGALAARCTAAASQVQELKGAFAVLFPFFRFSLRTQEQCFTQVAIVICCSSSGIFPDYLAFMICFRAAHPSLYFDFWQGLANADDVLEFLATCQGGKELLRKPIGEEIRGFLIASIPDEGLRSRTIQKYIDISNSTTSNVNKDEARVIVERYNRIWNRSHTLGASLYEKIEMAQKFV
jgi:hypothetical protein